LTSTPHSRIINNQSGILAADRPLVVPMQLRISSFRLRGIMVLVVCKTKGITLAFKNDPLESVIVSSTFDSIENIQRFLQTQIEGQLRKLFADDLPRLIHTLSLKKLGREGKDSNLEFHSTIPSPQSPNSINQYKIPTLPQASSPYYSSFSGDLEGSRSHLTTDGSYPPDTHNNHPYRSQAFSSHIPHHPSHPHSHSHSHHHYPHFNAHLSHHELYHHPNARSQILNSPLPRRPARWNGNDEDDTENEYVMYKSLTSERGSGLADAFQASGTTSPISFPSCAASKESILGRDRFWGDGKGIVERRGSDSTATDVTSSYTQSRGGAISPSFIHTPYVASAPLLHEQYDDYFSVPIHSPSASASFSPFHSRRESSSSSLFETNPYGSSMDYFGDDTDVERIVKPGKSTAATHLANLLSSNHSLSPYTLGEMDGVVLRVGSGLKHRAKSSSTSSSSTSQLLGKSEDRARFNSSFAPLMGKKKRRVTVFRVSL